MLPGQCRPKSLVFGLGKPWIARQIINKDANYYQPSLRGGCLTIPDLVPLLVEGFSNIGSTFLTFLRASLSLTSRKFENEFVAGVCIMALIFALKFEKSRYKFRN